LKTGKSGNKLVWLTSVDKKKKRNNNMERMLDIPEELVTRLRSLETRYDVHGIQINEELEVS